MYHARQARQAYALRAYEVGDIVPRHTYTYIIHSYVTQYVKLIIYTILYYCYSRCSIYYQFITVSVVVVASQ
jgi:hypothetical protein